VHTDDAPRHRPDPGKHAELEHLYRARVEEHDRERPGYARAWDALAAAVLTHGDQLIVPPARPDPRVHTLPGRLRTWPGAGALFTPGEPSSCHANAAQLWLAEDASAIATGYALNTDDGLWRQHTGALADTGRVIETTCPRDNYAGMLLESTEALHFAAANADPDLVEAAIRRPGSRAHLAARAALNSAHRR